MSGNFILIPQNILVLYTDLIYSKFMHFVIIENPKSANEKVLVSRNTFQNIFFLSKFFIQNPYFIDTFLFYNTSEGTIMETRLY